MARVFKAVLKSEIGHSRPKIGAHAAAYAHPEKSLANLAIRQTQMVLGSRDRESSPISPNESLKKPEVSGQIMNISPNFQGGGSA
jgi:hypothetical protein